MGLDRGGLDHREPSAGGNLNEWWLRRRESNRRPKSVRTPTGSQQVDALPHHYSTYLGCEYYDQAADVAVDETGSAYVTGYTGAIDFPTTPGAIDTSFMEGGYSDGFVVKLCVSSPVASLECPTGPDNRVAICHLPPGRPRNVNTLLPPSALPAHCGHGDSCGPCESGDRGRGDKRKVGPPTPWSETTRGRTWTSLEEAFPRPARPC